MCVSVRSVCLVCVRVLLFCVWFCASARGVSGPVRACVLSEVEICGRLGGLFITVNAHRAGRQWTVANGTEPLRRLDDRYGRYRTIPARPEPSRAERGNYL